MIKQTIDLEKCLVSVVWLVNGIHSLLDVLEGIASHSTFFSVIVPLICLQA
jgi:hypothetical protein